MKETIKQLNVEFGFHLSEEEVELICTEAEEANRLFQRLYEVDITGIMPILKVDKGEKQ